MRVAIDTNGLFTTQAGVARYIRGLLRGLADLDRETCLVREIAWGVENFAYRQPQRALKTAYRDLVWRTLIAPQELARMKPDVFHSTVGGYISPPRWMPWAATLHDLACFRYPDRFRRWQRFAAQSRSRRALAAGKVICISRFTADEAINVLGASPKQLEVVYNGSDFHPDCLPTVESAPGFPVPPEFFIFVGSLEPGKNLQLLKYVYEDANERGIQLPPLLIVGARWQGVPGEGRPPVGWHYLGRQPDEVLVYLYRRALALAFPSKYEGFGLPVVEAMALGCPVICAPVASLPEVGGDAPAYAPLDPGAWLQVMKDVAGDRDRRKEFVAAGLAQSKRFSWRRCAQETVAVYQSIHKSLH